MRVLKCELFNGFSKEKNLVSFINDNNIKQEDIFKLLFKSSKGEYALFYYREE
jgi:hypothetical protein